MDRSDDILELIDKIIGYADNQPLILNHLAVLREKVAALSALADETTFNYDTLQSQVGHLHAQIEQLRHELESSKQKPPMTVEVIERPPRTPLI
jgi:hypothetical protein